MKKLLFGLLITGMVIFAAVPALAADNDTIANENAGVFEAYSDMPNLSFEPALSSVARATNFYSSYIDLWAHSSLVGAERDYTDTTYKVMIKPINWNNTGTPNSTNKCQIDVHVGTKGLFGFNSIVDSTMYVWEIGEFYHKTIGDAGIKNGVAYAFYTHNYGIYADAYMSCI